MLKSTNCCFSLIRHKYYNSIIVYINILRKLFITMTLSHAIVWKKLYELNMSYMKHHQYINWTPCPQCSKKLFLYGCSLFRFLVMMQINSDLNVYSVAAFKKKICMFCAYFQLLFEPISIISFCTFNHLFVPIILFVCSDFPHLFVPISIISVCTFTPFACGYNTICLQWFPSFVCTHFHHFCEPISIICLLPFSNNGATARLKTGKEQIVFPVHFKKLTCKIFTSGIITSYFFQKYFHSNCFHLKK